MAILYCTTLLPPLTCFDTLMFGDEEQNCNLMHTLIASICSGYGWKKTWIAGCKEVTVVKQLQFFVAWQATGQMTYSILRMQFISKGNSELLPKDPAELVCVCL